MIARAETREAAAMLLRLFDQRLFWAEIFARSQVVVPTQAPDVEKTCLSHFTNLMAHGHVRPLPRINKFHA